MTDTTADPTLIVAASLVLLMATSAWYLSDPSLGFVAAFLAGYLLATYHRVRSKL